MVKYFTKFSAFCSSCVCIHIQTPPVAKLLIDERGNNIYVTLAPGLTKFKSE